MFRTLAAISLAAATAFTAIAPAFAANDYFPWSSERNIPRAQLEDLDCYGLWHARNEIYARNGYEFRTADAKAEFGSDGWTRNPDLNRWEERNIARIQEYERDYSCT